LLFITLGNQITGWRTGAGTALVKAIAHTALLILPDTLLGRLDIGQAAPPEES
jgi:hypothetical protein